MGEAHVREQRPAAGPLRSRATPGLRRRAERRWTNRRCTISGPSPRCPPRPPTVRATAPAALLRRSRARPDSRRPDSTHRDSRRLDSTHRAAGARTADAGTPGTRLRRPDAAARPQPGAPRQLRLPRLPAAGGTGLRIPGLPRSAAGIRRRLPRIPGPAGIRLRGLDRHGRPAEWIRHRRHGARHHRLRRHVLHLGHRRHRARCAGPDLRPAGKGRATRGEANNRGRPSRASSSASSASCWGSSF